MESLLGAAGIAAIVGLVAVLKSVFLPDRYAPLAALVLGLILVLGFKLQNPEAVLWFDAVFQGIVLGLSASGLYNAARVTTQGASVVRENQAHGNLVVLLPHPNGPDSKPSVVQAVAQPTSGVEVDVAPKEPGVE